MKIVYCLNSIRYLGGIQRYGYRPSKYGVMGPEFATVTTAIDNRGYSVCKVAALGKLTNDIFVDLFEDHLDKPRSEERRVGKEC